MSISRIFQKIIKIFQYIPIIWNDEDWDYDYLLLLLEYKLNRIKKCIRKNNIIVESEISQIETSIDKTLDAINKYDNYIELFPMIDPEEMYCVEHYWKLNPDRNTYSLAYMFVDGKDVPEDHEFYKYDKKYINRLYKWQQACWNRIWNTIRDSAQSWWD